MGVLIASWRTWRSRGRAGGWIGLRRRIGWWRLTVAVGLVLCALRPFESTVFQTLANNTLRDYLAFKNIGNLNRSLNCDGLDVAFLRMTVNVPVIVLGGTGQRGQSRRSDKKRDSKSHSTSVAAAIVAMLMNDARQDAL